MLRIEIMFIIYIFLGMVAFEFARVFFTDLKDSYNTVIRREEEARERERIERDKRNNARTELYKQLEAVQYQIKLLEALDRFRSDDFNDEKEVRKALALEKQYNALWTKERKLKSFLKETTSLV